MDYAMRLDLDLSALPLDDFDVVNQELTVESLTAGQTMGGHCSSCDCSCCNHCACPCVCCS
jgi:hypothetical protein